MPSSKTLTIIAEFVYRHVLNTSHYKSFYVVLSLFSRIIEIRIYCLIFTIFLITIIMSFVIIISRVHKFYLTHLPSSRHAVSHVSLGPAIFIVSYSKSSCIHFLWISTKYVLNFVTMNTIAGNIFTLYAPRVIRENSLYVHAFACFLSK